MTCAICSDKTYQESVYCELHYHVAQALEGDEVGTAKVQTSGLSEERHEGDFRERGVDSGFLPDVQVDTRQDEIEGQTVDQAGSREGEAGKGPESPPEQKVLYVKDLPWETMPLPEADSEFATLQSILLRASTIINRRKMEESTKNSSFCTWCKKPIAEGKWLYRTVEKNRKTGESKLIVFDTIACHTRFYTNLQRESFRPSIAESR